MTIETFPFSNTPPYIKPIDPPAEELTPEGKPLGRAPASIIRDGHRPQWINTGRPADRIVEIISRYLYVGAPGDQFEHKGRKVLTNLISRYIDHQQQIELIFPGFPFKSPSKRKVLGPLPDLGDELLLKRLEILAQTIGDYHPSGAVVKIVSDGIVYGDALGQTASTCYAYNQALRDIATQAGFSHLSFVKAAELLSDSATPQVPTKDDYVSSFPEIFARFLAHNTAFDLEHALQHDSGVLQTYQNYLKSLEADLEGSTLMRDEAGQPLPTKVQDEIRRKIAKNMVQNGHKFSDLIALKYPNAVRLSAHAHNNSGSKLSFNTFPGGDMSTAPWHNVVMEAKDGSLQCAPLWTFNPSIYEIVHRHGRPYYLREYQVERDFGESINKHITLTRNFPFGLIIEAEKDAQLSFMDLPMEKIRCLALKYSAVLIRGFKMLDRDEFRQKSKEMGEVVYWPKFGDILELKENPNLDMNSSLTCESMPMHYDGVFKTKRDENGNLTHDPATFQVFQCIHAPEKIEGGQTLLTDTAELIRLGLTPAQRAWLLNRTYTVYTPQNKVFGGDHLRLPIIEKNHMTGHDVLRWHEYWPQNVTQYKPATVFINDASKEESTRAGEYLTDLLYDRRFCYAHTWKTGDFLIADNLEMMHTRTAFEPCGRELWRIHVN